MMYLVVNLTKGMEDLYPENYKTLMKKIEENPKDPKVPLQGTYPKKLK
jgi:hypothetical protein